MVTRLAIDGGTPVRTAPFGPWWIIGDEERQQIADVMDQAATKWRSRFKLNEFTRAIGLRYGFRHVFATSCGTGALHAAVAAINPDPGDEIITTAVTDIGTLAAILQCNALPVFADWDAATLNMDPADIERRITDRTRAILVVHLFGNPCDMSPIMEIAKRHSLPVIEDCAQAHLAEYRGQKIGTLGDIACFSLGLKTLSTDQGGLVATNDRPLAERASGFLIKGTDVLPTGFKRGAVLGGFYPLTDLHAAIGIAQLGRLDAATDVRRSTAAILDKAFSAFPGFRVAKPHAADKHVYYVYPFVIDPGAAGVTLQRFVAAVRAEGIPDIHGPYLEGVPLHRAGMFVNERTYGRSGFPLVDASGTRRYDYRSLQLPAAERLLPNVGYFHFRNSLTPEDARAMAEAVSKVAAYYQAFPETSQAASGTGDARSSELTAHLKSGNGLLAEGKYGDALWCFHRAIQIDEKSAEAYFGLGCVFNALGQRIEARTAFEMAVEANPRFADAYHWLGGMLVDDEKYEGVFETHALIGTSDPKRVSE
ncbi:MAG: DegT/DnrJ/EryC1/StrS family aminotransferase, partial [Hyphomicrobium sp.]